MRLSGTGEERVEEGRKGRKNIRSVKEKDVCKTEKEDENS